MAAGRVLAVLHAVERDARTAAVARPADGDQPAVSADAASNPRAGGALAPDADGGPVGLRRVPGLARAGDYRAPSRAGFGRDQGAVRLHARHPDRRADLDR